MSRSASSIRLPKQKRFARGAGVLMPVSSLPSPYGIGTFGKEAYAFVDFLKAAKQSCWQVLPLGPTSYGDSPYQSFSAFAGNPYFIDLDLLKEQGLVTQAEIDSFDWGSDPHKVDYDKIYRSRFALLRKAYARFTDEKTDTYQRFVTENGWWLEEYASYMAIKGTFDNKEWLLWDEDIRFCKPEALERYKSKLADEIAFWKFCQFEFFAQWDALKDYAHQNGVFIIGDIPIYVALDSADVWRHPELFQLDKELHPTKVAGVPPDLFSSTGQLWGNPLYRWDVMEQDGFSWWQKRISANARLYDVIRIDHFIGITNYYAIPAGDQTAQNGKWVDGPYDKLIAAILPAAGKSRIIAEDLGVLTDKVRRLRDRAGFPGMALMQFGFDSDTSNPYLPHHFTHNLVAYGGTHDNETLVGYFSHQNRAKLKFAREYLGVKRSRDIPAGIIRAGYASVADTVIFLMQDYLLLDDARINTPSTLGINWMWRLAPGEIPQQLAKALSDLTDLYGRANG